MVVKFRKQSMGGLKTSKKVVCLSLFVREVRASH